MWVYVCMSGYAFRHALRYRAETWHGGRGRAHEVHEWAYFRSNPTWGQRSCRGQSALEIGLCYHGATKFGEKSPWPERTALLGSKVIQGSSGVNQGSSCLEMPYGHQICWEESLTSVCIAVTNFVMAFVNQNLLTNYCISKTDFVHTLCTLYNSIA